MADADQLEGAVPFHRNQHLFSDHYLNEVLPKRLHWQALEDKAQSVMEEVAAIFERYTPSDNERQTEEDLVIPVLKLLGHSFEYQPTLKTPDGPHTPDYAFYQDEQGVKAHKKKTLTENLPNEGGIAIGDAKYWNRPLDIAVKQKSANALSNKNPSYQIYFYMLHSGVTWGVLTNGKQWRLYHRETAHKLDYYYEVDLEELTKSGDVERFLYFYGIFRRGAFDDRFLSLNDILGESADFARSLSDSLKEQVYEALRHLAQGFLDYKPNKLKPDKATLQAIYDNSLILLYRLIFILYAESRELLPVRDNKKYRDSYSLRAIRESVATNIKSGRTLLTDSALVWPGLAALFDFINRGDEDLSVASFNGGLFDPRKHDFLAGKVVGDAHLQQAIDKLARVNGEFVDYRDLAIRHMGTIYEGLLEYRLQPLRKPDQGWTIELVNDKGERKLTGSYYTPDDIVKYIVEHTIGPVVESVTAGKDADADKAKAVLSINVLDPAMGSGHFLVEATEFIARYLVDLAVVPDGKTQEEADLAFWKRRVVQACIYGVDLNPLAVELAKLSLWLTTVAKDRPLSFLDHHLRPGNSLVGARLEYLEMSKAARKKPGTKRETTKGQIALLTDSHFVQEMCKALEFMQLIEQSDASTLEQVKRQEKWYEEARARLIDEYGRVLDTVTSAQVGMDIDPKHRPLLTTYITSRNAIRFEALEKIMDQAHDIGKREHYFHWELEFPEVYFDNLGRSLGDEGGFDAVIGNPPWERIKLQENEFFASRDADIALAPTAAERKRRIEALKTKKPGPWKEYEDAKARTDNLLSYVRNSGYYPLMGKGDTNYYALFAEKALKVMAAKGRVGLLVPSGIATDDTTKEYFQHLINHRMLSDLIDFENREGLFPDVDSRFKFSIILMAGEGSPQDCVRCGFFLHNMRQVKDEDRISLLRSEDFRLFNPNTLTCPIFRRRRDAELTRKIYEHAPVLIDKSGEEPVNPWGIRFSTMFHMANDSGLFCTAAELEEKGFWLGEGNVYTKGDEKYLPLYEGKMFQQYDHRAADVETVEVNIHRPGQQTQVTDEQHLDPDHLATSRFWVPEDNVVSSLRFGKDTRWLLAFKNVCSPTNVRSMIMTALPVVGAGHSIQFVTAGLAFQGRFSACLLANANSFAFDYVARQKIGGVNFSYFILEQIPVLPPETYKREWHSIILGDFIKERVLELCYTANDLKGFADDMGYDGPPFRWDEERRLHLRCQLDALYFHLYGLTRDEAGEILDTFPIVKRQDEAKFGAYRTKDLILAYYNAYEAGNMNAWVKG